MKNYVKPKSIYLYDFLMYTTFTSYVVVCQDYETLFEGEAPFVLENNDVGGYIIDSIRTDESENIYLEVHKQ